MGEGINVEIWIYRLLVAAAIAFIVWLFKGGLKKIIDQLKEINTTLKDLAIKVIQHDERIIGIKQITDMHDKRLDVHSEKIREIERKQDSCQYCKET